MSFINVTYTQIGVDNVGKEYWAIHAPNCEESEFLLEKDSSYSRNKHNGLLHLSKGFEAPYLKDLIYQYVDYYDSHSGYSQSFKELSAGWTIIVDYYKNLVVIMMHKLKERRKWPYPHIYEHKHYYMRIDSIRNNGNYYYGKWSTLKINETITTFETTTEKFRFLTEGIRVHIKKETN